MTDEEDLTMALGQYNLAWKEAIELGLVVEHNGGPRVTFSEKGFRTLGFMLGVYLGTGAVISARHLQVIESVMHAALDAAVFSYETTLRDGQHRG